ncbi:cupin domain-containing protein [Reyranella sp.]|uniref:cupin domain-containing protein n=1 Tax=Reyranella sp. TaxID=1929291 RepID=UPI003BAA51DF
MPDLFPTTEEAQRDKDIADAAAGKRSIVNHLGPDSFGPDASRPFFDCRRLGLKELTDGKVGAHVVRARPGEPADAPRRAHTLEFQFIYVLKGWAIFEYEGYGEHKLVEGSTVYQPPGISHREVAHSDDFEMLEITMPADFETETAE